MGSRISSGLGPLGEASRGGMHRGPHGNAGRALDCGKPRDPTPRMGKSTVWGLRGPAKSWAPTLRHHRPLGTAEEQVLGSLGCTEAKNDRFSISDIPDSNNSGWTLAWGQRERGRRRALAGYLREERVWLAQVACSAVGGMGW